MGFTCCVPGCYNNNKLHPNVRFYKFPKDVKARDLWRKNIGRTENDEKNTLFMPSPTGHRVCSEHFKGGRKTYMISVPTEFPPKLPSQKPKGRIIKRPIISVPCAGEKEKVEIDEDSVEAKYISQLDMEEYETENCSYSFPVDVGVGLEDFIDAKLAELDFGSLLDKATDQLDIKLKPQERKTREVNQLFANCEEQLKQLCESYADDMALESATQKSDSDDDVQFVDAGFEPQYIRRPAVNQPRYIIQGGRRVVVNTAQASAPAFNQSNTRPVMLAPKPMQSQFVPKPMQHPTARHAAPYRAMAPQARPPQQQASAPESDPAVQVLRPHTTMYAPPPKPADLVVGMKLYGKKFNDIWYKGTLTEIHNKEKPRKEWRYRIKFDGKGMKMLPGKQIAFADSPSDALPVGSRVVALYKDEDGNSSSSYYAGIVAESPSIRNTQRYLIFFDDGYAQYCYGREIHKVYEQSRNVWEDIHPDSQEFIKSYLKQYPERPMVRLQKGQVIKTEWNGQWWTAKVEVADASLVKMYFDADKRVEWIYRGSTRLEPLYTELANAEKSAAGGKAHRKHHLGFKTNKPFVEYLRGTESDYMKPAKPQPQKPKAPMGVPSMPRPISSESIFKKRPVAKKSTNKASEYKSPEVTDRKQYQTSSISRNSIGKDSNRHSGEYYPNWADDEALGQRIDVPSTLPSFQRKAFVPHPCRKHCLKDDDPSKHLGNNPLIIPMLCGWERQIAKQKNTSKKCVFYRAPCGRRFRHLDDIRRYLLLTNSQFTIDLFCFDINLHTHSEFVPIKTFCDIKDLSYGKETVPISCVNGIDRQYPDYVEYSNRRIPAKGVKLNLDREFLVGCGCKPGQCGDPKTCSCARLTLEARDALPKVIQPEFTGYQHRRLKENIISGIYECNTQCKCDHRCPNRVAQNGLQLRLQVFKTEKRGWGLRCLDDIPSGGFICVYAGQLLTEQGANEDGQQYGDEYLAELDYIEVVERTKDGYESDVEGVSDVDKSDEDEDEDAEDDDFPAASDSDSTFSGERYVNTAKLHGANRKSSRRRAKKEAGGSTKIIIKRDSDQEKSWSVKVKSPQSKTKEWVNNIPAPIAMDTTIVIISDEEDGDDNKKKSEEEQVAGPSKTSAKASPEAEKKDAEKRDSDLDSLGEQTLRPQAETPSKVKLKLKSKLYGVSNETAEEDSNDAKSENKSNKGDAQQKKMSEDENSQDCALKKVDDNNSDSKDGLDNTTESDARKSSRFRNLPDPKSQQIISPVKVKGVIPAEAATNSTNTVTKSKEKKDATETKEKPQEVLVDDEFDSRRFFNEEFCYVMDAKSMGNIGRYLNHSCAPNVFVQNVFVDTHDLRFPWVAFFAAQYIRAGTELTWDYNYEVGSVHGKILYCYCGAAECRGRLL